MRRLILTLLLAVQLPVWLCGCGWLGAEERQVTEQAAQTAVVETVVAGLVQAYNTASQAPTATATETPTPSVTPAWHVCEESGACYAFTLTPSATFGPSPTATLGAEHFRGSYSYPDLVYTSQHGLMYAGRKTNTGCTAACVQMLLDFWHAYDEEYPAITAQELLDINVRQNAFDPATGLNIRNTRDELENLGYYLGTRTNSNRAELLDALERFGPLLVLTKTGWKPLGTNHMALVSAYDEERNVISLLDPWQTGGLVELDYDSFDGIWGLNYVDSVTSVLQRSFFFIVPVAELRERDELFIPNMANPAFVPTETKTVVDGEG